MAYSIEISRQAVKFLRKVPPRDYIKMKRKIDSLMENPRPQGYEPVETQPGHYRIRQGNYRIIYTIEDNVLKVTVTAVADRKEIYSKKYKGK